MAIKKKQVYTEAQKEHKRAWTRARYKVLLEQKRAAGRASYWKRRDAVLALKKAQREANPNAGRELYKKIREKHLARTKRYYQENPEKIKAMRFAYRARRRELCKLRRAENPVRKIAENCRSRIYNLVKRFNPDKTYKTFDLIGCTPDFFVGFLEGHFQTGMTWSNYGKLWTIDHVIPVSSFDLTNWEEVKRAFHYSNCRPMDSFANSSKHDALPGPHQPSLI
jgi:hypothetical protein